MKYSFSLPYLNNSSQYYRALSELPWAVWLDSGGRDRYDILAAQPYATLITKGNQSTWWSAERVQHSNDNPFDLLRRVLGEPVPSDFDGPFAGGVIGYWGYGLSRWVVSGAAAESLGSPDMAVGIYDWALIVDHVEKPLS